MTFSMDAHVIVVDLGFGDAGKGSIVDWLCAAGSANAAQGVHPANRQHRGFAKGELQGRALVGGPVKAVIRFNGGAQAGHNVVTPSGRHHTFSQFGSGTFHGVPTHLSRYMVVDPLALAAEASALGDPYHLLTIDPEALVVTPWHAAANRAKETLRGQDRPGPYPSLRDAPPGKPLAGRHGSCGMGVGEAVSFSLLVPDEAPRVADCRSPVSLRRKLSAVRDALGFPGRVTLDEVMDAFLEFGATVSISDRLPLRDGPCVFEGAQGVLLDEWRGFHPYTTWSTTTFDNALALCPDAFRLGVVRTYTTRHGPGPLVTADEALTHPEPHNGDGPWQGSFRLGHFDAVAHRYAIEVCGGVDGLAVTHRDVDVSAYCDAYSIMDRIKPGPFKDLDYQAALTTQLLSAKPILRDGPFDVGRLLGAPVVVESFGPTCEDKK